jgi:hypothetical protein
LTKLTSVNGVFHQVRINSYFCPMKQSHLLVISLWTK